MKKLLPIVLLVCPLAVVAQTQLDYEQAMTLFMKYYNNGDTNNICQLFRPVFRQEGCAWTRKRLEEYGNMVSQKFVGIDSMSKSDNAVRIFKIRYSLAGVKAMSFSLDKNSTAATNPNELQYFFGTFSFNDVTPRIEQMVEQARGRGKRAANSWRKQILYLYRCGACPRASAICQDIATKAQSLPNWVFL